MMFLAIILIDALFILWLLYLNRIVVGEWIIRRYERRKPDLTLVPVNHISMNRWHIIPRNRFFNIYLHQHVGDDDNRAVHDHPWWSISFLIRNAYFDIVPLHPERFNGSGRFQAIRRQAGDVVVRSPRAPHRLVTTGPQISPCWSLFFTGPRVHEWGFWLAGKGWVPESKYRTVINGVSSIKPSND